MPSSLKANMNVLDKSKIIDLLGLLNLNDPINADDLEDLCVHNIASLEEHGQQLDLKTLDIEKYNPGDSSSIWDYIKLNLVLLRNLGSVLEKCDLLNALSVQEIKNLKYILHNIVGIGISSNILPNLPYYSALVADDDLNVDIFTRYKRLVATTFGILALSKWQCIKQIIFPYYLESILIALYQIIYCPIKQPSNVPDDNGFIMTQEIYNTLENNRVIFKSVLDNLSQSVHSISYIRETMVLIGNKNSPKWLKRAVSATLSTIIRKPKGIEHIAWAMLDSVGVDENDDVTRSWEVLDIIGKIITQTTKSTDFKENIGKQVNNLLKLTDHSGKFVKPLERLFIICTYLLFQQNQELCQDIFIKNLFDPLTWFIDEAHIFSSAEDLFGIVSQRIRILKTLLTDQVVYVPLLSTHFLKSVLNVIFYMYTITHTLPNFTEFIFNIKVILLRYIQNLKTDEKVVFFDSFLFGYMSSGFIKFRSDLELIVQENSIKAKCNKFCVSVRTSDKIEALTSLMDGNAQQIPVLFCYFVNCLNEQKKYFDVSSNTTLLRLEANVVLDEVTDRKIAVYKLLSSLSRNSDVQNYINDNPAVMVQYIKVALLNSIENNTHLIKNCETDEFQVLFIMVTLCNALIENSNISALAQFQTLLPQLEIIKKTDNLELRVSVMETIEKITLNVSKGRNPRNEPRVKTNLERVIELICDPLLPVRGHGLIELGKLIETKDESALERKNYVMNIFRQNLENEDSFIYLSAINGLATLTDLFPDTVLKSLCEEYSGYSRCDDDVHEVRVKVGEVLLRVVNRLGDMASVYKPLLINTFLGCTKNEDHLVRASSLSNLGELCRVLGYRLGSIVSEVLVCIHAIITTDKMIEPRRAAVTVIRQLFVGLEKETIVFLKDEILHIYRSLKDIYNNDLDDVMRLQSQLALEQLNENMKDFIFPSPKLHCEKKVIILD